MSITVTDYKVVKNVIHAPPNVREAIEILNPEISNDSFLPFDLNGNDFDDDDRAKSHEIVKKWLFSLGIKRNDFILLGYYW